MDVAKLMKSYTLNMCNLLYVNFLSIKMFFKKSIPVLPFPKGWKNLSLSQSVLDSRKENSELGEQWIVRMQTSISP